jgi:uncharacterized protein with HEPN domain
MPRDLDYLADIVAAARTALGYVEDAAYDEFMRNTMRPKSTASSEAPAMAGWLVRPVSCIM